MPLTFTERSYSFEVEGLVEGENTVELTVDDDPATAPVTASARYRYDGRRGDDVEPRDLIALDDDNMPVLFDTEDPDDADSVEVTGVDGTLLGIDYRPANGLLYGLSDTSTPSTLSRATQPRSAPSTPPLKASLSPASTSTRLRTLCASPARMTRTST